MSNINTIGKWVWTTVVFDEADIIELAKARLIATPPISNTKIHRYWVPAWLAEAVKLYKETKPADLTLIQYIRIIKNA